MSPDAAYAHAEHDRRIANLMLVGNIAAVNLADGTASVQIDDTWTTAFLPWLELHAGSQRKSWNPPAEGDQVMILSPSGEPGQGLILKGIPSNANPQPSQASSMTILAQWADGAFDEYDDGAHTRLITVPAGGRLVVTAGDTTQLTVSDGQIALRQDPVTITLQGGAVSVSGATSIAFGAGGKPVARVGDPVNLSTGLIQEGSSVVSCA